MTVMPSSQFRGESQMAQPGLLKEWSLFPMNETRAAHNTLFPKRMSQETWQCGPNCTLFPKMIRL